MSLLSLPHCVVLALISLRCFQSIVVLGALLQGLFIPNDSSLKEDSGSACCRTPGGFEYVRLGTRRDRNSKTMKGVSIIA